MADPIYGTPRFNLGDRVRIRHGYGWQGPIIEWRGPLGPDRAQVYRVQIGDDPEKDYTEVLEEQLILLQPATSDSWPAASGG